MDLNPIYHRHRNPNQKVKPSGRTGVATNLERVNTLLRARSSRSSVSDMPPVRRSKAVPKDTESVPLAERPIRQKVLRWGCSLCPDLHFKIRKIGKSFPKDSSLQRHVGIKHPEVSDWTSLQYKWGRRVYFKGGGSMDVPWEDEEPDSDLVSDTATSRSTTATPEPYQPQVTLSPGQSITSRATLPRLATQQGSPLRQEQPLLTPVSSEFNLPTARMPTLGMQRPPSYVAPRMPFATPPASSPHMAARPPRTSPAPVQDDPIPPYVRLALQQHEAADPRVKALFDTIRNGTARPDQKETGWKLIDYHKNTGRNSQMIETGTRDVSARYAPSLRPDQSLQQTSTGYPSAYAHMSTTASNDIYALNNMRHEEMARSSSLATHPWNTHLGNYRGNASVPRPQSQEFDMGWRPVDLDRSVAEQVVDSYFVPDDQFMLQMEYQTLGMRARLNPEDSAYLE